ncbi:RNA-binding (RRM/RBD/RNP motifs) family protein [Striga asiatica]|uniref:RNA-binding (RRM/RBD/RNP motifs) family protein n=1 Tax=Striga asiatica TaxID=4170 RepID=A0A5A7PJB6_STRAF|nr:RNA-binding (RRM/RBD/RNP motifs) family protein [Striga asiatica]
MEMDNQGKLFIGGISWDTNEDRLKEYFGAYGEVVEAVIMRDRSTGRARGFGFVVFASPTDAERVVKEKHTIDGRTVEAKKAVPRDDRIQGSSGPGRTKKIFVGGLASTVTEADFKGYFDQFGTITDVVVMYDHNTQRPRGFGFITYDSEDSVDRVLHKTFHELNGKTVEVKRAVPKELSPGPARSPLVDYNYGLGRAAAASFYNMGSIGIRMDGRYSPLGSQDYNYGRSQERYNSPIGYNSSGSRGYSFLSPPSRNVWGNAGNSGFGVFGANWGDSPGGSAGENSYGLLGTRGFGRNNGASSFVGSGGDYEGYYGDFFYRGGSVYGDTTWKNQDNSGSFGYGLWGSEDVGGKYSEDYVVGYDITNRQSSRGNLLS